MIAWGEKLAERLAENTGWMKMISIPLALAGAGLAYFVSSNNFTAALVVFLGLLLIAANEYWRAIRILNDPERLEALKRIEDKRQAHIFAYGGIWRELRIMLVIAAIVGYWFFFRS